MRRELFILLLMSASASAQEAKGVSRVLLDRKLQERAVMLTGIDARSLAYIDTNTGLARTESIADFLAILPTEEASASARPTSLIELADGQRFAGAPGPGKADVVSWTHAALGTMQFKLENVRRIQFLTGSGEHAPQAGSDAVVLLNGDRIDGFVETVGERVVVDVNGSKRELPSDRVQEVLLSAAGAQKAPGPLAWLRDGSIIACRELRTRESDVVLTPRILASEPSTSESPAQSVTLRLEDLAALAMDPGAMTPLASLPVVRTEAGVDRHLMRTGTRSEARWAALGLADVDMPGPMTIEWSLPSGVQRFSAEAELPRQMWTWGDCELVVSIVNGKEAAEVWRRRINADSARARISLSLGECTGRRLRITLEPGEYGPVQDRIVLHRGVLVGDKK